MCSHVIGFFLFGAIPMVSNTNNPLHGSDSNTSAREIRTEDLHYSITNTSTTNSDTKRSKGFKFLAPSLSSLGNFFFSFFILVFVTSFFYTNYESATSTSYFPRWAAWTGWGNGSFSAPTMPRPLMISHFCGDGRPGFLEEGGGDCDIFDGNWVWDDKYPLYKSEDCPFVDGGFRCSEHGRPNDFYTKWRWQPKNCNLPRFDAEAMLEKLRNKRAVFAGDSIARNSWESLLCMLSAAVSNKSSIYEVYGNPITKHSGFLVFKFESFNCTVEYYRSPFLVPQGHPPAGAPAEAWQTLRVDRMDFTANLWRDADILILSSGHWWSYEKTIRTGCYFQEGGEVKMNMSIEAAYRRSIETVVDWVDTQVDTNKTRVFFRSYSPSHFSKGAWNTGGGCQLDVVPDSGPSVGESPQLQLVLDVISHRSNASLEVLNVTSMTGRRRDGHPSVYKGNWTDKNTTHHQDCSHWCLPGVPDSWNELLFALFLRQELAKEFQDATRLLA